MKSKQYDASKLEQKTQRMDDDFFTIHKLISNSDSTNGWIYLSTEYENKPEFHFIFSNSPGKYVPYNDTLGERLLNGKVIYNSPIAFSTTIFQSGKIIELSLTSKIFKKRKKIWDCRPIYDSIPNWPIYQKYNYRGKLSKKGKYILGCYKMIYE